MKRSFELRMLRRLATSERFKFMKARMLIAWAALLCVAPMYARPAGRDAAQNPPAATSTQGTAAPQATPASNGTSTQESPGAAPLRVMAGKSLLLKTTERLKRV